MITKVIYTKKASKQMRRAPQYITDKLLNWAIVCPSAPCADWHQRLS